MKKLIAAVAALITAVLLVVGFAAPANAWYYNTMKNTGSLTLCVINTDGANFCVAGGNSASDVQYIKVPLHYRLSVHVEGQSTTTLTPCATLKAYTFLLPSARLNTIDVKRLSC